MPLICQGTGWPRQSFNPAHALQDAADSGATVFPGVPFMFEQIQASTDIDGLPPSLRLLITAGARIDLGTVRWFRERFNRKLHSFYGSSETGGIAYDDSEDVPDVLHVGRPMPETTIVIRAHRGHAEGTGRIFVSGPAVCDGYADPPGRDQASPLYSGFLTGDRPVRRGVACAQRRVHARERRRPQ